MRTVVCFGDSNTWGYVPGSGGARFPREARWPVRLQHELGEEWEVIPEGLSGRTATIDRPDSEGRNGLPYLLPCLHSHAPVDVLVIFLGTNDVNYIADDRVARCVTRLVKVAERSEAGPDGAAPQVLVVCPPPFGGHVLGPSFAAELTCEVLDLDAVAAYSIVNDDSEHLDENAHRAVATAVADRLRTTLG